MTLFPEQLKEGKKKIQGDNVQRIDRKSSAMVMPSSRAFFPHQAYFRPLGFVHLLLKLKKKNSLS